MIVNKQWNYSNIINRSIPENINQSNYAYFDDNKYRCWSQFLVMVATIFATYKNGLRHLVATTFATTLVSFFGLQHGTLDWMAKEFN